MSNSVGIISLSSTIKQKGIMIMLKWCDKNPIKSLVAYTILIGGAVFAYSKFVLIENTERLYDAQLETKDVIISQYEARISYLEVENSNLRDDAERYLEWLRNTPNTIQYMENENEMLRNEIDDLKKNAAAGILEDSLYTMTYDRITGNTTVLDKETGIVVAINDIRVRGDGELLLSIPEMDSINEDNVKPGYIKDFEVKGKSYQFIVLKVDYISETYSFMIRQLE